MFYLGGCPTKVTIDENLSSQRTCPACGDVAVSSGTSQDWLQCCFLRIIPLHTERVWVCETCDWRARIKESESTPGATGGSGPEMQQPRPSGEMQVPLATQ
ncbi:uncharacterized protein LAESUDRAFT_160268 [Laetiporus sulphureus 93-53]|uniref:Zinc-ribbon 15 domain-containing protein n=1 Tax=Laetiporus sulphureus 93-53 TaxID=1314785 RepID=A0A165HN81_9APHY|nr:uncharacterized protein LAESUDRAFT_160268 [Laetiporus sulphureus 93-53]KZT11958.1 hypothetical protein LAESUDRAFT_160268 [Laetiporus sulphureus 93-53]